MTYIPLPNIACIAGLIIGVTLILGADVARAEMRSCTEEEAGRFAADENLPVICDVMTVTAKRIEREPVQFALLHVDALPSSDDLKDDGSIELEPISWRATATY